MTTPQRHTPEKQPTVSVILCTYNGERYLREQLDSILSQSYPLHEIIIQDDCSTDSTPDILRHYASKHPQIRLFLNSENMGFNRNFHSAVMKATGDYVAISDQDDIWYSQKIAQQVATIGTCDLCFTAYHRDPTYSPDCHVAVSPTANIERLAFVSVIPGHTMLLRRTFAQDQNNWRAHTFYDWCWLICALYGNGVARCDEPLNWHRPHSASTISKMHAGAGQHISQHPTWQPYVYGYRMFRQLQQKRSFQAFYQLIKNKSEGRPDDIGRRIAELMTSTSMADFLRLCRLCCQHRHDIYLGHPGRGLIGMLRGYCYPLIISYGNTNFNL